MPSTCLARACASVIRRIRFARAAAAAVALSLVAVPPFAAATPLAIYGGLPTLEDLAISPDGSKIAVVRTRGDERLVAVISLADRKPVKVLRVGDTKLRGISWADDQRLLVKTSSTGMPVGFFGEDFEWEMLQVVDLRKEEPLPVPDPDRIRGGEEIMNVIDGDPIVRRINGHTILFLPSLYTQHRLLPCLVRYDLETNQQAVVAHGSEGWTDWSVGEDGSIVADRRFVSQSGQWRIRIARGPDFVEVASGTAATDVPQVLGFGPSGDTLVTQIQEDGHDVWKLLSLRDGKFSGPWEPGQRLDRLIEDPETHRLTIGVREADDTSFEFLDGPRQKSWAAIVRAYGDTHVDYVSSSRDLRKWIVLVRGERMGYQYQLVDLDARVTKSLGDIYDGIEGLHPVRRIDYVAADGLKIPAYLTLPAASAGKDLPLVVLAHGGPAATDTLAFDWWSQALADQGYAVLQANFRGSTVDREHLEAGYGQFGRKMQTDLSDGVRYLVQQGIADPSRVCIVGASYGGYAALQGMALEPRVYRCAVSVAGIADLRAFLEWIDEKAMSTESLSQRYWDRFLGVSSRKDPRLDEISPIRQLARFQGPVLLIHGRDDTVVPYDQSESMAEALRDAHKPVEMITLKKEDHWLSRGATRLQMLTAVVGFLRKNIPVERPPAAAAH